MKNILLLIILSSAPLLSFSQQLRAIDLQNKFIEPKEGSFYKLPNEVHVVFTTKNLGPDTMFAGDTIKWKYRINGQIEGDTIYELTTMVLPQDSLIFKQTIPFMDPQFTNEGGCALEFAHPPVPYNGNKNSPHRGISTLYDYTHYENNRDTVILEFRSSRSSIEWPSTNPLVLYPTPIKQGEVLNFTGLKANAKNVYIYDINGKKMLESGVSDLYQNQLTMPNLSPGIYFVKVLDNNNQVYTGKLTVQ